jgi:hypothetical protein
MQPVVASVVQAAAAAWAAVGANAPMKVARSPSSTAEAVTIRDCRSRGRDAMVVESLTKPPGGKRPVEIRAVSFCSRGVVVADSNSAVCRACFRCETEWSRYRIPHVERESRIFRVSDR